ncbi:fimbrial protein [Kluyvera cryocrescens]|uniref:fimbrial protein n=1 Tax=Kluyvera cryocrescens TaxID=580 RepID=UPI003D7F1CF0
MAPVTPTCDTHISVEGNPSAEINLGDGITPQQLSGDSTDKVPFTLVVDNCSATLNNVYVKMTSTRVDSNNATLLGQQSGSAAGVGVKITDTQDNPLLPDGTSALTFPYIGEVNHREMPMQAQLVSDGTPLQPGDFQASATFNISYD